jgi:hypothetical protein
MGAVYFGPRGLTLRTVKRVMDRGLCMDLLEVQQLSTNAIGELFQSEAIRKRMRVFLDRRPSKPQAGTRS